MQANPKTIQNWPKTARHRLENDQKTAEHDPKMAEKEICVLINKTNTTLSYSYYSILFYSPNYTTQTLPTINKYK